MKVRVALRGKEEVILLAAKTWLRHQELPTSWHFQEVIPTVRETRTRLG